MASRRQSGLSSPFDEMMEKTRKQFDDLSGGMAPRWPGKSGAPPGISATAPQEAAPREAERYAPRTAEPTAPAPPQAAPPQATAPPRPGPAAGFDPVSMDPASFLDERFGGGWRHEITDRRRDGDDVVVQCRLSIDGEDSPQSQMGRARIYAAGQASEIAGSADGVAFSFRAGSTPSGNGAAEAEEAAYREAARAALARCVEQLA
jgi:hypothetical protein